MFYKFQLDILDAQTLWLLSFYYLPTFKIMWIHYFLITTFEGFLISRNLQKKKVWLRVLFLEWSHRPEEICLASLWIPFCYRQQAKYRRLSILKQCLVNTAHPHLAIHIRSSGAIMPLLLPLQSDQSYMFNIPGKTVPFCGGCRHTRWLCSILKTNK